MKNKEIKLLESMVTTPSPSGYESDLAELIRKTILNYLPRTSITTDTHNNVVAKIQGRTDKVVMIDAHADQLGFLVNNIDKEGYISLFRLGGYDIDLLRGRKAIILSDRGKVNGVIGTKPAHLISKRKKDIPEKTTDLTLDIGVRKCKQVQRHIKIGDPVVLQPEFSQLIDDYYTGSGFDDKAGCFLLIQIIKQIVGSRAKPVPTLKFVFSAQEETGCFGAREVVRRETPDLFVGVDVAFATDQPEVDEREVGRLGLGDGLGVYRGINIHRPSYTCWNAPRKETKLRFNFWRPRAQAPMLAMWRTPAEELKLWR